VIPTLTRILRDRLIAVVRTDSAESLGDVVRALVEGGITIVEVTLTVPGAVQAIRSLAKEWGDRATIGAGTVLTVADANACLDAGAKFLVTPVVAPDVVVAAKSRGSVSMCGALTPTEMHTAFIAGADIVKLFPADVLGPGYLKALRGPFPDAKLMPTGGVDLNSIPDWIAAGACCLGVGSSLISRDIVSNRDWQRLTAVARFYRSLVPMIMV
jgi:2-dehydro-3-deoxyphosphogluconate aldolase/(4S)-4-hydroxy-2-oxoglutarate aldolase